MYIFIYEGCTVYKLIEFNSATKSKETRIKILGRENILG